jgi:hypothetical protein
MLLEDTEKNSLTGEGQIIVPPFLLKANYKRQEHFIS